MGKLRGATARDSTAIFRILARVAPEIPTLLDTAERRRRVRDQLSNLCRQGSSWVSLDEDGRVVGFLLGEKRSIDLAGHEFRGVELTFGGTTSAHRGQGRFTALIGKAKALGVPLRAVVKHANKSKMGERLLREGFTKGAASLFPDEDTFFWMPQVSAQRSDHIRH